MKFQISRQDAFARIIGILEQMGEGWNGAQEVRKTVGRIACNVRYNQTSLLFLADQAAEMRRTFKSDEKGFGVLGCLENVLRGGNRQSRN